MAGFHLLPERSRKRQQAALVDVETPVLVAADDVEGERRAVGGRVLIRHQQLQDAAAQRLALLQETSLSNYLIIFTHTHFIYK